MNALSTFHLEVAEPFRGLGSDKGTLQKRIDFLEPDDKLLVELALNAGATHRRIAQYLGVEPGTVSRRLRKVARRIHDPLVSRLLDRRCPLGPDYRQIGVEHFLTGRTIAQIAGRLGRSKIAVRLTLEHVRAWDRSTRAGALESATKREGLL